MPHFICRCEYHIADFRDEDNEEWKGRVGSFLGWDMRLDSYIAIMESYIESIEQGTRPTWMAQYYPAKFASTLTHDDVIADVFHESQEDTRPIYECEQCGRLILLHPRERRFFFFTPDDPDGPRGFLQPRPPRERVSDQARLPFVSATSTQDDGTDSEEET